ncbi:aspartate/glutamate racemase family protein [Muriicola marianensis]|uniref:Racemase n=1 Tax=Muriicola marianensis TaxID=1324801 RepID=A0ABQ1R561_9FLAO|nr:amino acid racemase [Muriicola marianensis]GGD58386.1 racemase [Muriicola marianensis]
MRKIGLIGGTSWHSTIAYYRLINEMVGETRGTWANPEMLIYSINIEIMREQDPDKINAKYLEVSQLLQRSGAEALVICANTPHMAYDHVQPKIDIPILHIAEATGRKAADLGARNLGLLGNKPTMTRGFIPEYLDREFGIETIIPQGEAIERSHHFVSKELTQGKFTEEARKFYLGQISDLKTRGADAIVLGCTELPLLIEQDSTDIPLLPTTQLHARMAADFILS